MVSQSENRRLEIINHLHQYVLDKLPENQISLIETFAHRYYATAPLADLYDHSLDDLLGALLSHWKFIFQRKAGEAKVRVFNPTLENDNWQSRHTIIEVSHDDIPFLVDSIRMEVNRNDLQIHFAIHIGGLKLIRNSNDEIQEILPVGAIEPGASSEAPIYFEIDRQTDPEIMDLLRINLERVLTDVRASVNDWRKMVDKAEESLVELERNPPTLDPQEVLESKDFLRWLINNNFTFLGCRDYKLIGNDKNRALQIVPGSGLGVLRDDTESMTSRSYADMPPQARKLALSKHILIIAKTNTKATVHRATYTDYISVKRFNSEGELIGERRFVGLYTSSAYHTSPRNIPFLRHKVTKIMQDLKFPPDSHSGKEVVHILETLPRDDLFQATHEELLSLTVSILQLQERKQIRLFVRKDSYGRFYSCLIYVPREIFNTELCLSMQEVLMNAFNGIESTFSTVFSDSVLARIHFIIRVNPKNAFEYKVADIEKQIISVARSWSDELKSHLVSRFGEAQGLKYFVKYARAFPASYTEYYLPYVAIEDVIKIESLSAENPLAMLFYKAGSSAFRLKLFHSEQTIPLSDILPTLENMGLRVIAEKPHEIIFKDGSVVWVNDFDMIQEKHKDIDVERVRDNFQDAFTHIWFGHAEDDGFNRLVIAAGLNWHEVAVLRGYVKYLRQTGFTFSQEYIEKALTHHPLISRNLVELFNLLFTPEFTHETRPDPRDLITEIESALDAVTSLDEDRILRRMLEVILATIRTNYFQKTDTGVHKSYISYKFDPSAISDLPLPKPMYEIFVYSPRVEGVHLRGGKVARGGIRWSDRREDFRTEILGLMKAQQVKNSVIVPVGAKGGFYPKQLPNGGDREAMMKEVVYCYSTFIRGLLDVTDNIKEGVVVPPTDVVRYDEDDYYLVVAADKGTATFSDIANGISKDYGFWLDDAFASGGSAGYDHKKMGITAKGAWESVKRHFRELDLDIENMDFTVVGIGDMAGDVFGNGMLLSNRIKLIGAFNHMHIFLDPDPNPEISFQERKRLFNLPRSAWSDYDPKLISKGGGVFDRSAKFIKLTPEIKKALNVTEDSLVPNDLIRAMLKSPVDLLWNGGIGTFAKASFENHFDVGDRTNDAIRVDGNEINARMVGEGGNLGFTQQARVEYALKGGVIYTDFIDNSAGVDCSDHEVNIKILLNKLMDEGKMTLEERNKLLEAMTNEVAELVLRDNYEQTQMLSLEASVANYTIDTFRRYMSELEKMGRLNRKLEFLPDEKSLIERKANGLALTRPEIAVLIAYCKMYLKQDIIASDVTEDPYFERHLMMAFPKPLCEKYFAQMKEHSLRREIIATQLGKSITDHMGINFIERLRRETGASLPFVIRAYVIAESIYDMQGMWSQIEALDSKMNIELQHKMMLQIYLLIRRATRWFLRNSKPNLLIEETIKKYKQPTDELVKLIPDVLAETDRDEWHRTVGSYVEQGVPKKLAIQIANCNILFTSLDIVEAASKYQLSLAEVAKTYYSLGSYLELNWLRDQMNAYTIDNQWDELARSGYRDDLDRVQRKLSVSVLTAKTKKSNGHTIEDKISFWLEQNVHILERWQNLITEIKSSANIGLVTFSVILRELFDFAEVK